MSHLPGRFGQNNSQQNEQRGQTHFPPNSYQTNSTDAYQGAAQNAAAAAANGLFLLSQAHQELTKREEAAQAANHPGTGTKRNNSGPPGGHNKRKSTDSGPSKPVPKKTRSTRSKRGRQSDDDMDGSLDGMDMDDSDAEGEMYDMDGGARGGSKPKKAETEEEKRKNFLERNRQGAFFSSDVF